uniref:Uncharacterized protein n=1 Tax=Glossina austeni TaxID=7395 RepID=A0A1A9V270_GLOAU
MQKAAVASNSCERTKTTFDFVVLMREPQMLFRHLQAQTQPLYSGIVYNPGLVRSWQPDAACKGAVPIHSRLPYMCGNTHVSLGITDNDENIPDLTLQLVSDLYNDRYRLPYKLNERTYVKLRANIIVTSCYLKQNLTAMTN